MRHTQQHTYQKPIRIRLLIWLILFKHLSRKDLFDFFFSIFRRQLTSDSQKQIKVDLYNGTVHAIANVKNMILLMCTIANCYNIYEYKHARIVHTRIYYLYCAITVCYATLNPTPHT